MLRCICLRVFVLKFLVLKYMLLALKKKITILGCHAEKTLGNSIKRS